MSVGVGSPVCTALSYGHLAKTHHTPPPYPPPPARCGRTRLMSVSYCRAEPELAVTTLARRKMPCSSSSFLIPRTWESSVCRSRSWRYFSFDPQMKSRSLRTCRRTNGVCWIIRYLRGETTESGTRGLYPYWPQHPGLQKKKTHKPSYFLTVELASIFLTRTRRKKNIKKGKIAIFLLFLVGVLRNLQGSWSPLQSAQSETVRKKHSESLFQVKQVGKKLGGCTSTI